LLAAFCWRWEWRKKKPTTWEDTVNERRSWSATADGQSAGFKMLAP
jgi:hypothetical protein